MAKLRVGGFIEREPQRQKLENDIKKIIFDNFQNYGYINIETPLMERNSVLLAKSGEDVSKQVFGVYGLAQGADDLKDYSLRYDLTVPMARYIIDHEQELAFPFKRFQVQKVYRGERSQKGRYKEFYQCDVDVVDRVLDNNYETETIALLYNTLQKLFSEVGMNQKLEVRINDRRLLDKMFVMLNADEVQKLRTMKLFDDYYKIGDDKFWEEMTKLFPDNINFIKDFVKADISSLDKNIFGSIAGELEYVIMSLKNLGVNVVWDPFIVRGLDYYSGTVFETYIEGKSELGSICSGGRYDNLVGNIRKANDMKGNEYQGFGGSIGLSRLLGIFEEMGLGSKKNLIDVMIFRMGNVDLLDINRLAGKLRSNKISTEVYYKNDKLDKQFKYAESKGARWGVFIGEDEVRNGTVKIKDLINREEKVCKAEEIVGEVRKVLGSSE